MQEESTDRLAEESTMMNAKAAAGEETQTSAAAAKFGWIQGVLVSVW